MSYERDTILKDLRKNVVEFFIAKEKGSPELISFKSTLREDILPKSYKDDILLEKAFHDENKEYISSFNIANGKWVVLNIADIKYLQVVDGF